MAAPDWQTANVPDKEPVIPADTLYDLLSEAIDSQAAMFPEPARFRNAVSFVLKEAHTLNVDELAAVLAWQRLERIFACLEHFKDPAITLDAIRCLAHMNVEQGVFMADLARKHGIKRQSLFNRVKRVSKFLGVDYRRTKPRNPPSETLLAPYSVIV